MRVLRPPASTSPRNCGTATPGVAVSGLRLVVVLATAFLDESQLAQHHLLGRALAHVVHRERGHRRPRERLHLDARLVMHGDAAVDDDVVVVAERDLDLAVLEPERMAE